MTFVCEVKVNSSQYMAIYYLDRNEVSGDKRFFLSRSIFRKEVIEEYERGERRVEPDKYYYEALFTTAQEAIYAATCIKLTNKLERIQKIITGSTEECVKEAATDHANVDHPYAIDDWMDIAFGIRQLPSFGSVVPEIISKIKSGELPEVVDEFGIHTSKYH